VARHKLSRLLSPNERARQHAIRLDSKRLQALRDAIHRLNPLRGKRPLGIGADASLLP